MGSVSSSEGEEAQDQAAQTDQERDPGAEPASAWSWAPDPCHRSTFLFNQDSINISFFYFLREHWSSGSRKASHFLLHVTFCFPRRY